MSSRILVIDGHDGTGKTTLARALSDHLGAVYVCPFSGEHGPMMLACAENGHMEEAYRLAREMTERAIAANPFPVLVLDRHWMTVCSLLPEWLWYSWQPFPPTILCHCDLQTALDRLKNRSEAQASAAWHTHYLQSYRELASRFDIPIVLTDRLSPDEALRWAIDWSSSILERTL